MPGWWLGGHIQHWNRYLCSVQTSTGDFETNDMSGKAAWAAAANVPSERRGELWKAGECSLVASRTGGNGGIGGGMLKKAVSIWHICWK